MRYSYTYLVLTIISLYLTACQSSVKKEIWQLAQIPTVEEVGQANMPDEIAPVKASFETIDFAKPVFPDDTIRIDLSENRINTNTIQVAINQLSLNGGGTLILPVGEWLSGRLELKSNVNLHIPKGCTLKFSAWVKDFQPGVFTRIEGVEVMSLGACIYANNQQNIAITGGGQLIGPSASKGDLRERIERSDVIENVVASGLAVEQRIYDGTQESGSIFPPMFISPINCKKVYIEGISLDQTAFWNIVPIYCNDVIIRGVKVNSVGIKRGDGIDIESSSDVLIEYSTLNCGDDCFTMKSGRGQDGLRINKPTENIVVRYCLAQEGHGGITCGSETAGMIRNLYVHDCVFQDTGVGIRFKTRRPRGGGGENLIYERIRMNLKHTAFKWDMLGGELYVGELARRLPALDINELTPKYSTIFARDILIEKATHFVKVYGIPESPLENLQIENVEANCTNFFYAHDIVNSSFKNMNLTANDSIIELVDARNISFENIHFNTTYAPIQLSVTGELSDSISIDNCTNIKDQNWVADKMN